MSESIDKYDLDIELLFPFQFKFTCPRCALRRVVTVGNASHLFVNCINPDCSPSDRNMSFEMDFCLEYGTYQGLLDVPLECKICGLGYEYKDTVDAYEVVPVCSCRVDGEGQND